MSIKKQPSIIDVTGEIEVIKKFIKNGDCVFDVGANIGQWTEQVLTNVADVKIHLFEPVIYTYHQLLNNLSNYFQNGSIYPNQIALSYQTNINSFSYYPQHSGLSTFYRRLQVEKQYKMRSPLELKVISKTLDEYCQELEIKRINFLKIDVEGAELDVLLGAKQLLEKGDIDFIQFEYGGTYLDAKISLEELWDYLGKFIRRK